jgi:hypothetical protein
MRKLRGLKDLNTNLFNVEVLIELLDGQHGSVIVLGIVGFEQGSLCRVHTLKGLNDQPSALIVLRKD